MLDQVILLLEGASATATAIRCPLPTLVLGGGAGTIKGGRHFVYPDHTPLTNLQLTLLRNFGIPAEKLGDSSGQLKELSRLS